MRRTSVAVAAGRPRLNERLGHENITTTIDLYGKPVPSVDAARLIGEVFEYVEAFYNPVRRHSTLGYLSAVTFEQQSNPSRIRETSTPSIKT